MYRTDYGVVWIQTATLWFIFGLLTLGTNNFAQIRLVPMESCFKGLFIGTKIVEIGPIWTKLLVPKVNNQK